jgi:hypothetical protein
MGGIEVEVAPAGPDHPAGDDASELPDAEEPNGESPSATHFELEVRWQGELKPPPEERLTAYFRKAGLDFALVEQEPGMLFWVLLVERDSGQMAADLDALLGGEYLVEFEQERDNRLNCQLRARPGSPPAPTPAPNPAPKTPGR